MRSKQQSINHPIKAVYFDGKRDNTFISVEKDGKSYKKKIVEEHIALLSEPNSEYIAHFTPGSGTASSITIGLVETLEQKGISLEELSAVGCD